MILLKKYKLNQYIPVVKQGENRYLFGINRFMSNDQRDFILFNPCQEEVYARLVQGETFYQSELQDKLGPELMNYFFTNHIVIAGDQDTDSIYSRAKAYYYFNKMGDVQSQLQKKSVVILGCGGIGTHVAWNLMAMGIGSLTLVDFDVVEESNLNRQLMYDFNDLGKLKVDVLKAKLNRINPHISINTVVKKIWSQQDLAEILSLHPYDLVVKALDSPAKFPQWLDNLSIKYRLPYICGITVSSAPMIGPTYIPGQSARYTDFFVEEESYSHVSGISASLGVVMYHISSELSMEAFKILSGKGRLKYLNSIYTFDEMKGTVVKLIPRDYKGEIEENDRGTLNLALVVMLLATTLVGVVLNLTWMNYLLAILAIVSPFTIYKSLNNLARSGFVNALTAFVCSLILVAGTENFQSLGQAQGILALAMAAFIGISVYTLGILAMINLIFVLRQHIRKVSLYER